MLSRKTFLQLSAATGLSYTLVSCVRDKQTAPPVDMRALNGEALWQYVRSQYHTASDFINLNNGGVSPQALPVQQLHQQLLQQSNKGPTFYMWREVDGQRELLRQTLAAMLGCATDELAINRNTTEGLNTVIAGLPLKKGDEVVLTRYDYPNMLNAWKQRATRDGIVLKWVDLTLPVEDVDSVVTAFAKAITPATRIVHVTHMINWTGQLLPVKEIAETAHAKGCDVLVDGAHTFAHIPVDVSDLGADYYATSLHKWLGAPFGTGALFIRQKHIAKIWPAYSAPEPQSDNIRKFENLGTRNMAAEMATLGAIQFHEAIGQERKTERLRYLKKYWYEKVLALPGVIGYTSMQDAFSVGIATFGIKDVPPNEIEQHLWNNHRIHTSVVNVEAVKGIRVTPHLYTTTSELDLLIKAVKYLTRKTT